MENNNYLSTQQSLSFFGTAICLFFIGYFAALDFGFGILIMALLWAFFIYIYEYFLNEEIREYKK